MYQIPEWNIWKSGNDDSSYDRELLFNLISSNFNIPLNILFRITLRLLNDKSNRVTLVQYEKLSSLSCVMLLWFKSTTTA